MFPVRGLHRVRSRERQRALLLLGLRGGLQIDQVRGDVDVGWGIACKPSRAPGRWVREREREAPRSNRRRRHAPAAACRTEGRPGCRAALQAAYSLNPAEWVQLLWLGHGSGA